MGDDAAQGLAQRGTFRVTRSLRLVIGILMREMKRLKGMGAGGDKEETAHQRKLTKGLWVE